MAFFRFFFFCSNQVHSTCRQRCWCILLIFNEMLPSRCGHSSEVCVCVSEFFLNAFVFDTVRGESDAVSVGMLFLFLSPPLSSTSKYCLHEPALRSPSLEMSLRYLLALCCCIALAAAAAVVVPPHRGASPSSPLVYPSPTSCFAKCAAQLRLCRSTLTYDSATWQIVESIPMGLNATPFNGTTYPISVTFFVFFFVPL